MRISIACAAGLLAFVLLRFNAAPVNERRSARGVLPGRASRALRPARPHRVRGNDPISYLAATMALVLGGILVLTTWN